MSLTGSRSWTVAMICSVLNFLHLGTARLSGSLYLAILERYHVDRSQASFPFTLCYTIRNISGPLVGYLAVKFGIYAVTMIGGLTAFVGIGCCYFAEDITMVILFWGIIFGIGFGMGSVLIPEILNHHFDKYVSNANGIAFSGECIAGFVLPIFLKFSFSNYGTPGTFLILSGLMLNSIPATLMLKYLSQSQSPKIRQRVQNQKRLMDGNGLNCPINGRNSDSLEIKTDGISFEKMQFLMGSESKLKYLEAKEELIEDSSMRNRNEVRGDAFNAKDSDFKRIVPYQEDSAKSVHPKSSQRNSPSYRQENGRNTTIYHPTNIESPLSQNLKSSASNDNISHSYPEHKRKCRHPFLKANNLNQYKAEGQHVPKKYYGSLDHGIKKIANLSKETNCLSKRLIASYEKSSGSHLKTHISMNLPSVQTTASLPPSGLVDEQSSPSSSFRVFLDPTFCLILLTQSTMLYSATMFWTIVVDFCRDIGLSSDEEINILICLSVLDMIGRLGLGWITDAGYVSNSAFSGMCCFGMGIGVGTLVFFRKTIAIGCSVSIFGLCLGGFLIVCPGVVNDHIHQDKRGMALASRLFLFAPMSLSQSPLIGYFRGKLGSYNFIFIILAVLCMLCCVTSLLTPYAEKCKSKRTNGGILKSNFDAIESTADFKKQLEQDGFTKSSNRLH